MHDFLKTVNVCFFPFVHMNKHLNKLLLKLSHEAVVN